MSGFQTRSTKRPAASSAARARPAKPAARPRWSMVWAVAAVAAVVVAVVAFVVLGGDDSRAPVSGSAVVGGDLHAVAVIDGRRFVSGHEGAAYSDTDGSWHPIEGLSGKDGMAWASVDETVLVGGHEGLYASTDGGTTFAAADTDLPVSDVHALGAAGKTVYVASPQGGLLVSTDGARTFEQRSDVGGSFMGTMSVDPADLDHVLAPDMTYGVVETRDGGATWRPLGGPAGAMSVAWNPADADQIVATGMAGSAISDDAGQTWQPLDVPPGAVATTFTDDGTLVAAALAGTRAEVYLRSGTDDAWSRV